MKTRIFYTTFAAANLGLILYGILALVQPKILLDTFLTNVYQFPLEATEAIAYLAALYRLLGYLNIIPGLLGLLLLYRFWSTRQSWYLRVIIASTALTYIGPIIFDNTIGTIGFFELLEHIIFAVIIFVGLIMLKNPEEAS